jgi:dipeptidyl aminopeptidase/acylaminoacyl peptidase
LPRCRGRCGRGAGRSLLPQRPFRAILYNHGSEQRPGWKPELGRFFSDAGYVFFVPHRRSHGRSPRDAQVDSLYNSGSNGLVALHELHLQDQLAALDYLRRLAGVDPHRIAGCSYGGIQTVLALEAGADGKASFRAAKSFLPVRSRYSSTR